MDRETLLSQAVTLHQLGRLTDADAACKEILKTDPNHFYARHLLGIIHYQLGRYETAISEIERALASNPEDASAHNNLGNALQALDRCDQALASYDRAIALKPDYVEVLYNRGTALQKLGLFDAALASYDQAIAFNPGYVEALNNRGRVLRELKRFDDALASFDRAAALKPGSAEILNNRGTALLGLRRFHEGLASFERAIELKPGYAEAFNNKAGALQEVGKLDEAIACYEQALHINPDFAEAHSNLGNALRDKMRVDEAIASYRKALYYKPDFAQAHNNLGTAFRDQNKLEEAVAQFERAIAIQPHYAEAHNNLGATLKARGQLDAAVAEYERALVCDPDYAAAYSNLLFCLIYDDRVSSAQLFAAHQEWDVRYGRRVRRPRTYNNDRSPRRRLRIGYVSADFRQHSVAWFLRPLLAAHDRGAVAIFCYAEVKCPDVITGQFKSFADHWRVTVGLSDEVVAAQIAADGIDILVDLAGHTAGNRLGVFARKPAPVQVTWLGYPSSSGLSAIDYRLVDAITDPEGDPTVTASEKLVQLDRTFLCYGPPVAAPPPGPVPSLATGIITFGSFNNPTKYSAATIDAWAELLRRLPDAQLLLKGLAFADASTRALYRDRFSERGVPPQRIFLIEGLPGLNEHLAYYSKIDIALDPFPYNGTTTTCEALWMGVPVISLRGTRHSARVGASVLGAVGVGELVADSLDEYVNIAVQLAADRSRLLHLRGSLRTQVKGSPLCDALGFARKIESAYRWMWERWCEGRTALPLAWARRDEVSGNPHDVRLAPSTPARLEEIYIAALRHHQAGQLAQAESLYRRILEINPKHSKSLHHLGLIAHQTGKSDAAIALIEQAIAMNKRDPTFHYNLAEALRAVGRFDDAVAHYKRAIALNSSEVDSYIGLGLAFKAQGKLEEAATHYRRGLAHNPTSAEAHNNLGRVLAEQDQLEQAVEHFRRAAVLRPASALPQMNLGNALRQMGKLDEAIAAYRRALTLDPQHPEALMNFGAALYQQGNTEDAVAHYRRALELKPEFGEAQNNLGKALLKLGRLEEASACFARALQLLPDEPDPPLNLCAVIYRISQQNRSRAVELAQNALRLYPRNELLKRGVAGILELDINDAGEHRYITAVFDMFAESFDETLESLRYDMPYQLADKLGLLETKEEQPQFDILDAGCGTGLCGKYLRPVARSLVGVDLSSKMLAKARSLSLYNQLVEGDVVDFMRSNAGAFDMVVSSDVLPYLGDLNDLITAASVALRAGGLFAASVESLDHQGEVGDFRLAPSGRYQHSKRYLEDALRCADFNVRKLVESVGRMEWGRPVKAWIVVGEKLSSLPIEPDASQSQSALDAGAVDG